MKTRLAGHTEPWVDADDPQAAEARRSLRILCWLYLVLGLFDATYFLFANLSDLATSDAVTTGLMTEEAARMRGFGRLAGHVAGFGLLAYFLKFQIRRLKSVIEVTNAATLMIILLGLFLLASRLVLQLAIPNFTAIGIVDLVVLHLLVCVTLNWTPKETALPFAPLLLVWAVTFLVPNASTLEILDRVVFIIISPVVLIPGAAIAGWRRRRRREDEQRIELAGQVESYGDELSRARIVHDAMFPPPFTGAISFEYEYQPIHEIGGDYVHVRVCPHSGKVTLTLLDVAGHGLAAALTVNRLFGEIERIIAENALAEPAEIIRLLNRYINFTMAAHSLYATGTCMMLDPTNGELKWVNAGHPPSLVRRLNGDVRDLETTTMLLGVLDPDEFDPEQATMKLQPGEVVIAYTDGAFEARNGDGSRFGLDRVRETARFDPPPRSWPKFIAGAVAQHHEGHADDDVLIAALTLRSLRVAEDDEFLRGEELSATRS